MDNTAMKVILSLVIIAVLVAGIFIFTPLSAKVLLSTISGSSTLSISSANLKSSNPHLSGEAFLVTFRSGGLGQSYFGSFSPSDIEDASGEKVEDGFDLDVDYTKQSCNYDITGASSNDFILDELRMVTWDCFRSPSSADAKDEWEDQIGTGKTLYYGRDSSWLGGDACWVIGSATKMAVGDLSSPDIESEYTIKIETANEVATKTINSLTGSGKGQIGDFAYAVWQGNLVSGKSCPDKDPYMTYYDNGNWKVGNADAYAQYKPALISLATKDRDERIIALDYINDVVKDIQKNQKFGDINGKTSLSNAVVEVELEDYVQFPLTSVYIKADSLTIYTPSPEIKLYDANSECFETGDDGSIGVVIENVGDERGIVNLYAECSDPFTTTRNIEVSIDVGESVTRYIPLSASANKVQTDRCVIYAETTAGTIKKTVGVCVKPQTVCEANARFCSTSGTVEVVKRCNTAGTGTTTIKKCDVGEFCNSDLQCEDEDTTISMWNKIKNFFSNPFTAVGNFFGDLFSGIFSFFSILKLVLVGLGALFTVLFSKNLLDGNNALSDKVTTQWIISLIIGGAIALLLFLFIGSFLFWIILIGSAIFFFFGSKIKEVFGR